MGKFSVRYLVAKRKKNHTLYYWQPTKELRLLGGFLTMRLASKTNNLADAIKEAEKLNAEVDQWRTTGSTYAGPKTGTMEWLTNKFENSLEFKKLAAITQGNYSQMIEEINRAFGKYSISAVTRPVCKAYYEKLAETSLSKANYVLRILRRIFNYAKDCGDILINPAEKMRLISEKPRDQVWSDDDIDRVIYYISSHGNRPVALAIILAEHLGQRQNDILKMKWSQYNGSTIRVRQNKTEAYVEVKCSPELNEWLNETPRINEYIVNNMNTKTSFKRDNFGHLVSDYIKSALGETDLQFRDLRRTAVVRLAEAGCSLAEVVAITGHSLTHCQKILETYLPRNAEMAANAVDKRESYKLRKVGTLKGNT